MWAAPFHGCGPRLPKKIKQSKNYRLILLQFLTADIFPAAFYSFQDVHRFITDSHLDFKVKETHVSLFRWFVVTWEVTEITVIITRTANQTKFTINSSF